MINPKLHIWANALIKYYFEKDCNANARLELSKHDLPEVFTFTERFRSKPEVFSSWTEDKYLDDFMSCFKNREPLPDRPNFVKYRAVTKKEFWDTFRFVLDQSQDQPYYLPYIALFILPIVDDEINDGNSRLDKYYDFLDQLTESAGLKTKDGRGSSQSWGFNFSEVGPELVKMWDYLEAWSCKHAELSPWRKRSAYLNQNKRHIKPFFAECPLTSTQKKLFPRLFFDSGAPVDAIIDRDFAKSILKGFGKDCFGYPESDWNRGIEEGYLLDTLVDEFLVAYPSWNGEGRVTIRKRIDNRDFDQEFSNGTRIGVRLVYTQRFGYASILFKAYKDGFCDTVCLPDGKELRFTRSGWARSCFDNDAISFLDGTANDITLLSTEEYSAIFRKAPVYLFEKIQENLWATTNHIRSGDKYLVLIPGNTQYDFTGWLQINKATRLSVSGLPNGFEMFSIDAVSEGYNDIPCLRIPDKITVALASGAILTQTGLDVHISDSIALAYNIDGISADDTSLYADDGIIKSPLLFNPISHRWELQGKGLVGTGRPFQICRGDKVLDRHKYYLDSPRLAQNDVPSRDRFGRVSEKGQFKGLSASYTIDSKIASTHSIDISNLCSDIYMKGNDRFLYDLSSVGVMQKKDFKRLAEAHSSEDADAIDIDSLMSDLEKSGYIETSYSKEDGVTVYVIPPTLVMVPSNFIKKEKAPDEVVGFTRIDPVDEYFHGLVLGARSRQIVDAIIQNAEELDITAGFENGASNLSPVQISLYSKEWQDFSDLARRVGLIYKGNSYYCAAVMETLPSAIEYLENCVLNTEPTYRYPADNTFKGFKCLDYSALASNMRSSLSYGKNFLPIVKKRFDPELDLVSYPEDIILWYKGKAYNCDKYWGHYIVCSLRGITDILQTDPADSNVLCVPAAIKLPSCISRALTLATGLLPYEDSRSRTRKYRLVDNPYMQKVKPKYIIKKLTTK